MLMIKLYGFGGNFGMVDASPFVVKVDLFLRVADIPFESIGDFTKLNKSPKGKLPFIEDGNEKIGDSTFIQAYLTDKYQVTLNANLSAEEEAIAHLINKTLDENLYWCLMYCRWVMDDTWNTIKRALFKDVPAPLLSTVAGFVRRGTLKSLHKQGTGRHSEQEVLKIADDTFQSLSALLGDKNYFFGDEISSLDINIYAHIAQFILVDYDNAFNQKAREYDNLVNYCKRIHQAYY